MSKSIDLIGQTFGRLTIISLEYSKQRYKKGKKSGFEHYYLCKCECGNNIVTSKRSLLQGSTKSCGCLQKENTSNVNKKHGMINTRLYHIWNGLRQRCNNIANKDYKNYGSRGIKVCEEWDNNFKSFYDWAINNKYKDDLTIDRIDVNGDYKPSNCRWVDYKTQANNRTDTIYIIHNNQTKTIQEWSNIYNLPVTTIKNRLRKGESGDVLFRPKVVIKTITFNNQTKTITEWAEQMNLSQSAIYHRLDRGWSIKDTLTIPQLNH